MNLASIARRYRKTPCLDGYAGGEIFQCQLLAFDDSKRDSETAERRLISLDPGTILPARRVVQISGKRYVIGNSHDDIMLGSQLSEKYVVQEADSLMTVRTIYGYLTGDAGVQVWGSKAWIKNQASSEQNDDLVGQYHINISRSEILDGKALFFVGAQVYITRMMMVGSSGMQIVVCDEMPAPVLENATITTSGVWDPVQDKMSTGNVVVPVVRIRWQSYFDYQSLTSTKFGPEDLQVAVAKTAATPVAGTRMVLSDGTYQVQSVTSAGLMWVCHLEKRA